MDINDLRSIVTVVGLLCFPGDRGWAYGKSSKQGFEEAAQCCRSDDDDHGASSKRRTRDEKGKQMSDFVSDFGTCTWL